MKKIENGVKREIRKIKPMNPGTLDLFNP